MVFSKKACDMYPSLLSVFASMVQCIEEGSEEQDVKRASLQADRVLEAEKFLPPTSSTWLLGQYVEAPRSRESLELTEAFEQQLRALQEAQQEKDSLLQDELTTAEGQLARLDEGDEESRSFVLQHMDSLYAQRDEEQASPNPSTPIPIGCTEYRVILFPPSRPGECPGGVFGAAGSGATTPRRGGDRSDDAARRLRHHRPVLESSAG